MLNVINIVNQYLTPTIVEGQGPDFPESLRDMNETEEKNAKANVFKLPISYLDNEDLFLLSKTVSDDLELVSSPASPIYNYLFQPKHEFARNMIAEWNKQYTTNTEFLTDSKTVILGMNEYKKRMEISTGHTVNCEKINEIWKEVKTNPEFLTKYGYIEWDMLKNLNQSATFLEALSITSIISPIISLIIPFLLLLFPFIILKIQNVPITFELYYDVLKSIAQNHFIGKALTSMNELTPDKLVYLIITFGLYALQIYQNVVQCQHFYANMYLMNDYLCEMRDYSDYSIKSMTTFLEINNSISSHEPFFIEMKKHLDVLVNLNEELKGIEPFTVSLSKVSEMGYLLKCFYELHSNKEYENALQYSMGFEGYINNLLGVHNNIEEGFVTFATFDRKINCEIEKQCYPPLVRENPVKNSCSFEKNMVISSPNAGGKTTIIKATMINIIFTQQVGCGFYQSCALNPYTHIHSYLNIPDTSGRDSLFQAESRRCKEIIDIIHQYSDPKYRHFGTFDELFSGTNPMEATKSAYAFLLYLSKYNNVNFILTTHYLAICKKLKKSKRVQNYKMEVENLPDGGLKYTYKMKKGISKIQGAVKILQQMSYPPEIIECIQNYK